MVSICGCYVLLTQRSKRIGIITAEHGVHLSSKGEIISMNELIFPIIFTLTFHGGEFKLRIAWEDPFSFHGKRRLYGVTDLPPF